jgi:hypothetical protein
MAIFLAWQRTSHTPNKFHLDYDVTIGTMISDTPLEVTSRHENEYLITSKINDFVDTQQYLI